MEAQQPYAVFPILDCGVDWLTCTRKEVGVRNELEDWAYAKMERRLPAAGQVTTGKRLGFTGHSVTGLFVGRREGLCMVQLSGPLSTPLAAEAIRLSTNVSRVDLQVTVFCEGERPHLALWTRNQMLQRQQGIGKPGRFDVILGHPDGETLAVNRRCSEQFGRLYDKTAEAKLGEPRLLWRYEVEWKGKRAQWVARALAKGECNPKCVSWRVYDFWTKKGVQPAFECPTNQTAFEPFIAPESEPVLDWFRKSVSKTVAKAVRAHGLDAVLHALSMDQMVQPRETNRDRTCQYDTVASDSAFDSARAEVPERVLLH